MDEGTTFLEFVRRNQPFGPDGFGFGDTAILKHLSENVYVFRQGKPAEDRFDFGPFFPTPDGRPQVDRTEAGMFFRYRAKRRRLGLSEGEFEPYPPPKDLDDSDFEDD